jgi:signal recognition particle receptor subunit beta
LRYKIIITGAVGAGKTTAIGALTDQTALQTDAVASDLITSQRKKTTTVALDYGVVKLNDDDVAHVYGTPGQERFDFMWDILSEGAHGLILLIDDSRNYPFRDLKYYYEQFADLINSTRVIIGITRSDLAEEPTSIETYQQWLKQLNLEADVLHVDARVKEDIYTLVQQLVAEESSAVKTPSDVEAVDINSQQEISPTAPVVSEPVVSEEDELVVPALETMNLTRSSMEAVGKIQGVTGVTLTNDMGELIDSSINDESLNELIAFISGMTPSLEEIAGLGEIHRIMLRGPKDDNLTVFVEAERSLGVVSERKKSIPALSQQIEDMLQWV